MKADIDLLPIIDLLYSAALDASLWPIALSLIGDAVGARGALIVPTSSAQMANTIASSNLEEANLDYCNGWWQFDTRVADAKSQGIRPGMLITDHTYATSKDRRSDPFFQDFLVKHGLGSCAAYTSSDSDGNVVAISTHRDLKDGAYHQRELDRLRHLAPHMARAFSLTAMLSDASRRAGTLADALQHLQFGMIVLDRYGRAKHVSDNARALLGDGLQIGANGQPRATLTRERAKLDALVSAALPGGDPARLGPILLRQPSGTLPLFVSAIPVRENDRRASVVVGHDGGALLMLRELFKSRLVKAVTQLEHLGLTRAEARLSALIGSGRSTRDAADSLSIAESTARTQLKSIFLKLGISRQTELAIIVTQLNVVTAESLRRCRA